MTKLLKVYRLSRTSISFSQRLYSAVYSVAKWRMRDVRDYHRVATDRVVRMRFSFRPKSPQKGRGHLKHDFRLTERLSPDTEADQTV